LQSRGQDLVLDWQTDLISLETLEDAWQDEMASRITAPYRDDRELLRDYVALVDLRQQLYTLKVRSREWLDEGYFERDTEHARASELEMRRIQQRADRIAERVDIKRELARKQGIAYGLDAFCRAYGLSSLELNILLILLLEDITTSGQKTYSRGRDLLGILLDDRLDVLEARRVLYGTAPLLRHGLMQSSSTNEATVLDAYFKIAEKAVQEIATTHDELRSALAPPAYTAPSYRHSARDPAHSLGDVVLPAEVSGQVRYVVDFVANRSLILDDWGFGESHGRTGQCTVLFAGLPGTGKTMTAQAVAAELGKKVLLVCYPEVVSKWVGDTEKNIVALFAEARASDAVLVFDEADAMFHTRVNVTNATDQSFNREVNVLLQEVERFDGVMILTTNRADGLDPALERRIVVRVEFPQPDAQARKLIWERHLPAGAPLADDVDLETLARSHALSGGQIRNAALRAAVSAATRSGRGRAIRQSDLRRAAEHELNGLSGRRSGRKIGLIA